MDTSTGTSSNTAKRRKTSNMWKDFRVEKDENEEERAYCPLLRFKSTVWVALLFNHSGVHEPQSFISGEWDQKQQSSLHMFMTNVHEGKSKAFGPIDDD
ncbi:hypothetical protein YC2023_050382 [Brassica napus]